MSSVPIDAERFRRRFDTFSEIGATDDGGVNRPTLSDENKAARDQIMEWFEQAGLTVTIDEMGNIFGRRSGEDDEAAPVQFGSHIDSQYNGGRFDGVVGVLGALEVIESLNDADVTTRRPLEIAVWSNEEGVRFQPDMLGSGVFCDVFDLEYAYSRTDKEGNTFEAELERIGYKGDTPCEPRELHCYFEIHVEQGPFLEEEELPLAAVEGVFGFSWMNVTVEGQANHAGPTPMDMRRDAMMGVSDVTQAVRRMTATEGTDLVGTVGSVDLWPNAINVIPETAEFTVDVRSYDNEVVENAVQRIQNEIEAAAEREGLDYEFEEIMRVDADPFDQDCIDTVVEAIESRGYDYTRLVSGAGHDANYLNTICPSSMIFVPSVDGISHRESEYTEWADIVAGAEVLLSAVMAKAAE